MLNKKVIFPFFSILLLLSSVASAGYYPDYLNGDRNFIICGAHMGAACYVKKSSVVVQNYNLPNIEIYAEYVVANYELDGRPVPLQYNVYKLGKIQQAIFRYNTNSMTMMVYNNKDKAWHYIKPAGSMADTGHWYPGEMAYYIAFGQRFYGSRQWTDPYNGRTVKANCGYDEFYAAADNAH